jgi:hypothetical protein
MALTIEHANRIHILGIIGMVVGVLMPVNSTAELSKEGAISWFNDQEIIAKVEGGTGLLGSCCLNLYVRSTWHSLKRYQKELLFSKWIAIWKNSGGNTIIVFDIGDPQHKIASWSSLLGTFISD